MHRKILAAVLMILAGLTAGATTRNVLFLGNSYIYTNNLPLLLQNIGLSLGDTMIYDENNVGGYTMADHSTSPQSIGKIYSRKWDIVVLQEQSQRTAFDPSQVATDTYPYAHKLDSMVHNNYACSQTMFYQTWGYKNGDPTNCAVYPPICTYEGMQQRIRESYLQMAMDNKAILSPVGAAWKQVRDSFPGLELYQPDQSHPSVAGTYLAACVFYASIFHKSPVGTIEKGGLLESDAIILRRIAARVVLDSFSKWNNYGNYVYANFSKSITGSMASFTNTSLKALNYTWSFGNGNTSNLTNPTQNYAAHGAYLVTLTASNNCFSEIHSDSVITRVTGINNTNAENNVLKVFAIGDGKMHIVNANAAISYAIDIADMNGRVIEHCIVPANTTMEKRLTPGMYVYRYIDNAAAVNNNRVLVY